MGKLALIFDTETTCLFRYDRRADQPGQPRLCSIAAELVDMETRKTVDSMHRLCDGATFTREDWIIAQEPRGAFDFNGLSAELMLREGVPIMTILQDFKALEDHALGVEGYVAYSGDFDLKVMRGERRRSYLDDRYNHRPLFDPKWKMKHLIGNKTGPSQANLYEGIFGEKIPRVPKGSKARDDLHALRRLFIHALDICQPLEWKYHESKKAKEAAE